MRAVTLKNVSGRRASSLVMPWPIRSRKATRKAGGLAGPDIAKLNTFKTSQSLVAHVKDGPQSTQQEKPRRCDAPGLLSRIAKAGYFRQPNDPKLGQDTVPS
jgi:hypothetical protein